MLEKSEVERGKGMVEMTWVRECGKKEKAKNVGEGCAGRGKCLTLTEWWGLIIRITTWLQQPLPGLEPATSIAAREVL